MKRVGLDYHGVINTSPKFFSEISHNIIDGGGEVHIITGSPINKIIANIEEYDIKYSHIFSIVDWAKSVGIPIVYDNHGDFAINSELWDTSKALYCLQKGIGVHIDDSKIYGQYFKYMSTKYIQYDPLVLNIEYYIKSIVANTECEHVYCNHNCPTTILFKNNIMSGITKYCDKHNKYDIDVNNIVELIMEELC